MSRPSLNDLTAFVAVATRRSFRHAADELGTAPSTLSHAMRALEERMGVRLLNRTTRSVSPTEAGFELLARLRPALATLDEALDSIATFRGGVAGNVRINVPRLAATLLVRDHAEGDALRRGEIARLERDRGLRYAALVGPRAPGASPWLPAGHAGWEGADLLRYVAPDLDQYDVFLCGPGPWMDAVRADLRRAGVASTRIHAESFTVGARGNPT